MLESIRAEIRRAKYLSDEDALAPLIQQSAIDADMRERITARAIDLVTHIRESSDPSLMELFLSEYGLSSEEGVALMCLAEALLRVPDGETMDALIEDKIAPSEWGEHLGRSNSPLINASTWALFFTGKVLATPSGEAAANDIVGILRSVVRRLGEPLIREAVTRAMKEMGDQFVLGETIHAAMDRAQELEASGYCYSYDMLGEAALSEADARRHHLAYMDAITELAASCEGDDFRGNPGISIKLSALHPRYETLQRDRVLDELTARVLSLANLAQSVGIGLNIDAEEAHRLDLSLDVIEVIARDPALAQWPGLGVVVQAYSQRAPYVLDWLYALAGEVDRQFMVRLVKGAYWDSEIKAAQVDGRVGFPVFTRKCATDVSYICCARRLLDMSDRLYAQFATHNAHTVAAIIELASDNQAFEFQRLHGMGETVHEHVLQQHGRLCRIYAPVGAHKDLLAYLVRRLLENGANSSFVSQLVDETVSPSEVATDPFRSWQQREEEQLKMRWPSDLFLPERVNSGGYDLSDTDYLQALKADLVRLDDRKWNADHYVGSKHQVVNPATGAEVGSVRYATIEDVSAASARIVPWSASESTRREVLERAAQLFEANATELFYLLMREAGKTLPDCVSELREAVDFLRFYAAQAEAQKLRSSGVFVCISPWNFPLAIFSGQVAAALAVGNGVLAKPAEDTSLIADFAVALLYRAGVPSDVLICLPGAGHEVGAALVRDERIDGVCFTGSTLTAQSINRDMATHLVPHAPLIAETGGLNAMIVDSTALLEQAVQDVMASAFQSAGQRCSALRILYVQEDIAESFLAMLLAAMDELRLGDPDHFETDIGPVISATAQREIQAYVELAASEGRLLKQMNTPQQGTFVGPSVISVAGIEQLTEEVFGPVLHVATFDAKAFGDVIERVNQKGYGLTFGLHTRIDDRVQYVIDRIEVGNVYVNRNQIGAVVGSQPFGGEGLSGTGPKAGGPSYLHRFLVKPAPANSMEAASAVTLEQVVESFVEIERNRPPSIPTQPLEVRSMPGPTGESNQLRLYPRGRVLCLGPRSSDAHRQLEAARARGCTALAICPGTSDGLDGRVTPDVVSQIPHLAAVVYQGEDGHALRAALAARSGPIAPMLTQKEFVRWLVVERHVCIDNTASGGNADLMS